MLRKNCVKKSYKIIKKLRNNKNIKEKQKKLRNYNKS